MGQYFSNESLPSEMKTFEISILGVHLNLSSDNGVFSKKGLDYGTRILLENLPLREIRAPILDVGCGYGPIGLAISKKLQVPVDMIDVNKRALHLAKMNARKNELNLVNIFESNCYEAIEETVMYETIITNPPIRAGKKIVYEIVMGARFHLAEDGNLFIVVRKEQGAKSMLRDLEAYYIPEILTRDKGYYVIRCKKK